MKLYGFPRSESVIFPGCNKNLRYIYKFMLNISHYKMNLAVNFTVLLVPFISVKLLSTV